MSKLSKVITNNNNLKTKISSSLKQGGSISVKDNYLLVPIHSETQQKTTTLVDDSIVKGGYHVLNTIEERDAISCCYRKQGMKVVVVGPDFSFKEYVLMSPNCDTNLWEEIRVNVDVDESEVSLIEDYSELGPDIQSQMELNTILKNLLLQLQQDIQEVEVPTKTSQLQNDGEDGLTPFITSADVEIESDIISDVSEGNITAGQVIPQGTSLTEFVELFLIKVFNPTFTNPSFSLSSNAGTREIGETFNLNLTTNFSRGSINGNTVSGVWNPSAFQNPLTGTATETTIDGTIGTSLTYSNYKTVASQSFSAIVKYANGVQPKDNKGGDFSSPYPSGQLNASTQFNGGLRRFAGQTSTVPTTGEQIRSMLITSSVLNTGNSFTITANGIDKNFVIAVPSTKTMVKVMTSNNENVTSNFNISPITTVPDAGGDPQSYKVYIMSTVGVFSEGLVLTVTLK